MAALELGVSCERYLRIDDLPGEYWRRVKCVDDTYSVSSLGRVRREPRYPGHPPTHIVRPVIAAGGYLHVSTTATETSAWTALHRLVCKEINGGWFYKAHVRHLDGYKMNNRAENLRYGTAAENADDSVRHRWEARQEGFPPIWQG